MDKSIEESIQKYENKKQFCEVKLRTRQSFREDQAALERRLSRRGDSGARKNMQNGDAKSSDVECLPESSEIKVSLSTLENIVVDLDQEKNLDDLKSGSMDKLVVEDGGQELTGNYSRYNRAFSDEECRTVVQESSLNGREHHDANVKITNGHITGADAVNGFKGQGYFTGEMVAPTFNEPTLQMTINRQVDSGSTLINRPRINTQARFAMTPEPRLKAAKGIYQKNPKLMASSTEHLDSVSMKGLRPPTLTHGQRIVTSQLAVLPIPAAEVTSLPPDGNLCIFGVEQMVTVFRMLNLPEELIYRLHKCNVDGKRFAIFTDAELQELGMNNPIIRYFRDRSSQKLRRKVPKFIL